MKFCKYCGDTKPKDQFPRRTASPDGLAYKCKLCQKAYSDQRYKADPEKAKASARRWATANRERRDDIRRASAERRREDTRSIKAAHARRRRSENPERHRLQGRLDAFKRRQREAAIAPADRRAVELIVAAARGCCTYCGNRGPLTLDHITPLADGGDNAWDNLLPACKLCNSSKQAACVADWVYDRHGIEGLARTIIAMKISRKVMRRLHPEALHGFAIRET